MDENKKSSNKAANFSTLCLFASEFNRECNCDRCQFANSVHAFELSMIDESGELKENWESIDVR